MPLRATGEENIKESRRKRQKVFLWRFQADHTPWCKQVVIRTDQTVDQCSGIKGFVAGGIMLYSCLKPAALAQLCADMDPMAWDEFISRYQQFISVAILRVLRQCGDVPAILVDDLLQETYLVLCTNDRRLLRQLAERYPNSLNAMLCVVARNVTYNEIRVRRSKKRGANCLKADLELSLFGDELASNDGAGRIELGIQLMEIDRLLLKAPKKISSARDRSIFWLHFQAGLSARSISKIPTVGLTAKGVEGSLNRAVGFIKKGFRI